MRNFKIFRFAFIFIIICIFASYRHVGNTSFSATPVYNASSEKELNAIVKAQLLKSCSDFTVRYEGNVKNVHELYGRSFEKALENNDYLKWNITSTAGSFTVHNEYISLRYNPKFLTTEEEEIKLNEKVKEIIHEIIKADMNDVEKVKSINDYITSKVRYDKSYIKRSAYSALFEGKSVCQGYTLLGQKCLRKQVLNP